MRVCKRVLSCRRKARARNHVCLVLSLLSVLPGIGLAQTTHPSCSQGGCTTPSAPAQPTITPVPSLDGAYEVKVYNSDPNGTDLSASD
jgi:hypothetical protein